MSDLKMRAAEMFAAGKSVNAVATALFKRDWARAKKLHVAWLAEQGGGAEPAAAPKKRRGRPKKEDPCRGCAPTDYPVPEVWDVTLEVPSAKVDLVFAQFTPQEKASAVAMVLQERFAVLLEG
jgi:hypothetical protein